MPDLPPGLSLAYLRLLTGIPHMWAIVVRYAVPGELPIDKVAGLQWDLSRKDAQIIINSAYYFSPQALARAICHELLELSMIRSWAAATKSVSDFGHRQAIREARDEEIEDRMATIPFFTAYDVAIPRSCIGRA